jgi:CRISPR-associated endonuclease/helicase Cas3
MGGEDTEEWDLEPERPAIIIGTQDMLLSRALNRGYGMSRFRWPMHYGLLNNDCLWVLDEIQLMGVGLSTSGQLQAFRDRFGVFGPAKTIWMSATLLPSWLETVDHRAHVPNLRSLGLTDADRDAPGLSLRWRREKTVEEAGATSNEVPALAALVKEKHVPGSLTLVVVNRVDRSRDLFAELQRLYHQAQSRPRGRKAQVAAAPSGASPDLKLIHSRFRRAERAAWGGWLKSNVPTEGRIVVSTQVVEAGVDISARTLWTELAPWPSMIQRFGRCNRRGEFAKEDAARIFWIDVRAKDAKGAAPYTKEGLDTSRERLKGLGDASLTSLHDLFAALDDQARRELFPYDPPHVIRRKDFIDLFDTTPDLAGNDIDVSRFIREGEDLDVQVFWRDSEPPPAEIDPAEARRIAPIRDELCPVPVGSFREFVENGKHAAFRWDALDGRWRRVKADAICPGQVFWLAREDGGYSPIFGWDPKARLPAELWIRTPDDEPSGSAEPEYDSDLSSRIAWRSIAEHTDEVIAELAALEDAVPEARREALALAARWHDWGKAHTVFQDAIRDDAHGPGKRIAERAGRRDIAKAAPDYFWRPYVRKHFRHEFASAMGVLTLLRNGAVPDAWRSLPQRLQNLALYLIAAHHGKVRLSIRSMPDERKPWNDETLFARGVWHGDQLPGADLGGGAVAPAIRLDLSPMQLGRGADGAPSWAERMLDLRDDPDVGPLRLAFLEAILRAADMRASKKAGLPTGG